MAKKTTTRKPIKVLRKKAPAKAPSKKKVQEVQAPQENLFNPTTHRLVPKHDILSTEEIETLFSVYQVSPQNLPIIFISDPGLTGLNPKMGDIVRITRDSPTAGTAVFYRRVAYE